MIVVSHDIHSTLRIADHVLLVLGDRALQGHARPSCASSQDPEVAEFFEEGLGTAGRDRRAATRSWRTPFQTSASSRCGSSRNWGRWRPSPRTSPGPSSRRRCGWRRSSARAVQAGRAVADHHLRQRPDRGHGAGAAGAPYAGAVRRQAVAGGGGRLEPHPRAGTGVDRPAGGRPRRVGHRRRGRRHGGHPAARRPAHALDRPGQPGHQAQGRGHAARHAAC